MAELPSRKETMDRWDNLRSYFREHGGVDPGGSHPRDVFEGIIDDYDECINDLLQHRQAIAENNDALRTALKGLLTFWGDEGRSHGFMYDPEWNFRVRNAKAALERVLQKAQP